MTIDYKAFYKTLEELGHELKERFPEKNAKLVIWVGLYNSGPSLSLHHGTYSEENKVEGKHLGEMMQELERRIGFAAQQSALLLTSEIEGEFVERPNDVPNPQSPADDTIPY